MAGILDFRGKGDIGMPNIMLIVIDTLRATNMSCHGYGLETCPVMDKFAEEGTRFNWAFSENPPTQPWVKLNKGTKTAIGFCPPSKSLLLGRNNLALT